MLGIIFVPLTLLYHGVSTFYRRSSVETKRLDSLMRSVLYGSYSGRYFFGLICFTLKDRADMME